MPLKQNYRSALFLLVFAAAVAVGVKRDRKGPELDLEPVSSVDSINLGASHPLSAPQFEDSPRLRDLPPASAGPMPVEPAPAAEDLAQLRTLDQVLASRNDNDPRLDTELRKLSPAAKSLLRGRYASLQAERRNERGTIVFLVGRNLSSHEDVAFLRDVLAEAPCRSLADCKSEDNASVSPEQRHHEPVNETTLAYPQIVALKALESLLDSRGAPELSSAALAELENAKRSPVRKVSALAEEITRRYRASHP